MIKTAKIRHYVHCVPHRGGVGGNDRPMVTKDAPLFHFLSETNLYHFT